MDALTATKTMVQTTGTTAREISRRMGRSDDYVSVLMSRDHDPSAGTFAAIANACGYRVVARPRTGGEEVEITG